MLLEGRGNHVPSDRGVKVLEGAIVDIRLRTISQSVNVNERSLGTIYLSANRPRCVFNVSNDPIVRYRLVVLMSRRPLIRFSFRVALLRVVNRFFKELF